MGDRSFMIPDPPTSWHVYMVRCSDNTLYTGIAKDLERRIAAHNSPKGGAKYTRARQPVELVYAEPAASRSAAAKREYRLRRLPQRQKKELIAQWEIDKPFRQTDAGRAAATDTP